MKKRMKNLMSVILAVLLVAGVMPAAAVTAFADEYDEAETIAADTFKLFDDIYGTTEVLKFVPEVSDVYRFYTENGGGSVEIELLNEARTVLASAFCNNNVESEIRDIFLYAEDVYYIRVTTYSYGRSFGFYTETQHEYEYTDEDITLAPTCLAEGKANAVCKHCNAEGEVAIPVIPHADTDSDGFCNACGKRLSYTATEDNPFTFSLIPGDTISIFFVCPRTADYIVADNGGYYTRRVFDSDDTEIYEYDSKYSLTSGETYRVVYTNYPDGSDNQINFCIRHSHIDNGDGTCSICSQEIYKIAAAETELEFMSPAREYTYISFTPEETGLYRFSVNSEYDNTYVSQTRDKNGNTINYSENCMSLVKDNTYIITLYNYSSSDDTAYVMFTHKHTGSAENPDVCTKCGKTFRAVITEGNEQTVSLEPYGAMELVFNCETAGRYMLVLTSNGSGISVESPRDEDGQYENYVDGYYEFAAGTSHYYHVYSSKRTEGSVSVTLTHKHKVSGNDGKCDVCGKTVCQTIAEGEIIETVIPASDEYFIRFTPTESGRYNFFTENSNVYLRGIYKSTGEYITYSTNSYNLEKDVSYDFVFYSSGGSSGKVKFSLSHDHYSTDDDNLCDRCNTEFITGINEDETETVSVPACNVFYVTFTPQYNAVYNFNTTGGFSCSTFTDIYGNYQYSGSRFIAGRMYKATISAYNFKQIDGTVTATHLHEDTNDDGKCDFCGSDCTVTLTEDVPVTLNIAPNDSVIVLINCQRTGKYRLISNGPVSVSYLYDDYGGSYSTSECDLTEGNSYKATIRNMTGQAISQTVTFTHVHIDKNNDTKCDVCDTVYRYTLVTDAEQTVSIAPNESAEFIYVPEKTGNYVFISNGSFDIYDINNYYLSSYYYDRVRGSSSYHLSAGRTYIVKIWNNSGTQEDYEVNILATHAHDGPCETIVEAGVATNGVEKLTCSECGESFFLKKYHIGNDLGEADYEDFHYYIYEKNGVSEISISGYNGEEENVVIPSEIDGIPVTNISGISTQLNSGIKSVVIPDSVRVIGDSAFVNMNLTSVTIPDSVEIIESSAFILNYSLETVNIGSGIIFIGKQAFTTCFDDETKAELSGEIAEIKEEFNYMFTELSTILEAEITSFDELREYAQTHELPEEFANEIEEILYYADYYNEMFDLYDRALETEESSLKTIVYNGTQADWDDVIIEEDDGTIAGAAFSCLHTATLMVDGEVFDTITFSETQESLDLPDVPEKRGYTGTWSEYTLAASDIEITAVYEQNTYYATVTADGNVIDTIPFVYGQKSISLPDVPKKEGYTGSWPNYTLSDEDITIDAVYTVNSYAVTFIKDGEIISSGEVEFGQAIASPRIPEKKGYEFKGWNPEIPETMPAKPLEFTAVYEPVTYYATFMADGEQVGDKIPFTVESESIEEPAVPEKEGCTGVWEDYQIELRDITVNAVYTVNSYKATYLVDGESYMNCLIEYGGTMLRPDKDPVKDGYAFVDWDADIPETMPAEDLEFNALFILLEYKATFVADGVTVGEVLYTVESTSIEEPAVPAKEGYTGKWESYEFVPGGITVNAVYTKVEAPEPENPTANARINVKSDTVYKNSDVTVAATASGVPSGFVLAIYEGDRELARGDNSSITYKVGEVSSAKTLTVKVIDASGSVQKDAAGNELTANIEISLKTGFFNNIIAFFRKLFRANTVTIRP